MAKDKPNEIARKDEPSFVTELLPPELAKEIPPNVLVQLNAFFARFNPTSPIASKITSEHITKALDLAQDNANKNFEFAKGTRWFQFIIFCFALSVFIFFVVFLIDKPHVLTPILSALGGFIGGWGLGKKIG